MYTENYLLMTGQTLPRKMIYDDTINTTMYACDAAHGSVLSDKAWRVVRIVTDATGNTDVQETDWYDNSVEDLATVQALSYK